MATIGLTRPPAEWVHDDDRTFPAAHLVSASIHREYPSKVAHLLGSDRDVRAPRDLTPMFYGCFDWHSAVHSHWALVRLLRLHPRERWASDVRIALSDS